MLKRMRMMGVVLMVTLMVVGVGAWAPFAWAGAKEIKPKAPVPETGQTLSYADGDDGDVRAGVAWPVPRFTDRDDGTVRDNLTGLLWLQDVNCGGNNHPWLDALTFANTLASGICGLTDGSVERDWRLPNIQELQSLVDFSQENPAFPAGHPFTIVLSGVTRLWSSTTRQASNYAWTLDVRDGDSMIRQKTFEPESAWAVRGGN